MPTMDKTEPEALRLFGVPEATPANPLCLPLSAHRDAQPGTGDQLGPAEPHPGGTTANIDVTVSGARHGDVADASQGTSSIASAHDRHGNYSTRGEDGVYVEDGADERLRNLLRIPER